MINGKQVAASVDTDIVLENGGDCDAEGTCNPYNADRRHDPHRPARQPRRPHPVREQKDGEYEEDDARSPDSAATGLPQPREAAFHVAFGSREQNKCWRRY